MTKKTAYLKAGNSIWKNIICQMEVSLFAKTKRIAKEKLAQSKVLSNTAGQNVNLF